MDLLNALKRRQQTSWSSQEPAHKRVFSFQKDGSSVSRGSFQLESPNGSRSMASDRGFRNHAESSTHNMNSSSYDRQEKTFQRSESVSLITNRLVEMLDHIERRVEMLRDHACAIEQERDTLLSMINTIQSNKDLNLISEGEREEIEVNAQRLMGRTLTVEVSVTTPRNEVQKKALENVNNFIDELLTRIRTDLDGAKRQCHEYLNACLPDSKGLINQKFQAAIIECTADDQKKTRKRLESLLSTITHAKGSIHP